MPSASGLGGVLDDVPPQLTDVLQLCVGVPVPVMPLLLLSSTVVAYPALFRSLPSMGVELSLVDRPLAGSVKVTVGANVSTVKVSALLVPVLPAASVCVTWTV